MLFTWITGTVKTFCEDNGMELSGSIAEKIYVKVNGVEQGMIIREKDMNNPVLLFLYYA